MDFTELTGAARLLLVTVIGLRGLRDCLTVGNLRRKELGLDLIDVVEVPLQDIKMLFALTVDNDLLEFLGVLNDYSRILLVHAVE